MKILFYMFLIVNFLFISFIVLSSQRDINQRVFVSLLNKTLVTKREQLQSAQLNHAKKLYFREFAEAYWTRESNYFGMNQRQESISLCDIVDEKGNGTLDKFGLLIIQGRFGDDSEIDREKYLSFLKLNGIESDKDVNQFSIIASFPETKKFKTEEFKRAYVVNRIKSMMLDNPDGVFDALYSRIYTNKIYRFVKDAISEMLKKIDQTESLEQCGIKRQRES